MGTKTKIEWTEATWNPVRGCSIVSEGCRNCYAMRMAHRSNRPGGAYEGLTRIGAHGPTWTGDVRFVPELLEYPLRLRKPHRIFVNSMSDLFHEKVTDHQIAKIFGVMMATPHHTYQILTKRPQRARDWFRWIASSKHLTARELCEELALPDVEACHLQADDRDDWPLTNVWLGVSVEDQTTANERIPWLFDIPAAVRWVSVEPLLGPIDLTHVDYSERLREFMRDAAGEEGAASINAPAYMQTLTGQWFDGWDRGDDGKRLDWVVVGGESSPGARPMHPDWVRSIRDRCETAGVPFFFKQWGSWVPTADVGFGDTPNAKTQVFPAGTIETYGGPVPFGIEMRRIGKKAAGHLLDGREYRQYPEIQKAGALQK